MTASPAGTFDIPHGGPVSLADVPTALPDARDERTERAEVTRLAGPLRHAHLLTIAHEQRGLLIIFQGMDASGKDEAIRDVLSAADARGVSTTQIKKAGAHDLRRPFLFRTVEALPLRGQIGIFNRSYYEDVVSARVHPERLDDENLPDGARRTIWRTRHRQINDFERLLVENGIAVLKLFMHVSRDVQRDRLLERIDDPDKNWEFSEDDIAARERWDDYAAAYEAVLAATSTERAPWFVVPADRPWAARAAVARHVVAALESFHDGFPEPEDPEMLARAREALTGED
ncbi:MAG TPA: PPK2 family polyphosphate kinase [Rubricoccaceae bacterium]|jgi:PPK2 family polyphosphate:nucleotide phosphotransferase